MARVRSRIQRTLLLVVALLLLLLLLELDRWLPGTWTGGSGGGFRAAGQAGLADLRRPAPDATPPAEERADPATVIPPDAPPPDWPPRDGVLIEVRGPDGDAATGWRLGTGDGGPEDGTPDAAGRTLQHDRGLVEAGFRVRREGRVLRHRFGTRAPASRWIVHLPDGAPPEQRQPATTRLAVRDAQSGRPIPQVLALWQTGPAPQHARTDEDGIVEIPPTPGGTPVQVTLRAPDHIGETVWIAPRDPQAPVASLAPRHTLRTTLRWADGTPARFSRIEVRAGDGTLLASRRPAEAGVLGPQIELDIPATARADARLYLRPLRAGDEGLRIDLPVADLAAEQVLPETRTVLVHVRGVDGQPLDRAQVLVEPQAGEAGGPESAPWRVMTNTAGEARVTTQAGQGMALLVTRGRLGPAGRRLGGFDGSDGIDLVLAEGVQVPVQVVDAAGKPIAGATLAARGAVEGVRVEQGTAVLTDAEGRGSVGPLAEGEVELYATAPGRAWASAVAEARHAMGTVRMQLEPAGRLRVVVADSFGVPLEGARVDLTVASGGATLAAPPGTHGQQTDAEGQASLDGLPDRRYDLTVTAPGFGPRVLRGLVPGEAVHFVTLLKR